jgi:hypothetical protein
MRCSTPINETATVFCTMCGAVNGDLWETHSSRPIVLLIKPAAYGSSRSLTMCNECFEGIKGLQNTAPQKPDRIQLLSQIRRATIDDQKAVLDWLHTKFSSSK